MRYLGDFDKTTVIYGKFTTFNPTTGAPATLDGAPTVVIYKDGSLTDSTSGVSLTADFDSMTGLNHLAIDTSTDGTFYSDGSNFSAVLSAGTVGGVSVAGSVVASFTIRKSASLKPTTAGRTLDVSAGGEAGIDWANIGTPGSTVSLSATTISTLTTYTGNTPQTGDAYARIGAAGAGLTSLGDTRIANLDAAVTSRMASYTQPTGFLAATFPATVASPTNITAGVITTVTNLTNLPAITTDWITAAGVSSAAVTKIQSGLSTYAGGDTTGTTTLLSRLTSGRASNLDNLDAAITSRMATYVQPTGFLAATFPAAVASPTNITAGTISTVTNLTNLPTVPTDWLTAAGVKADAVTKIQTGLSTYAGGDTSGTTTLLSRLSNTRATNLDNLDAAVTSRMATYTQPTGFLAATFPATLASPTNITAGVITTVTNLTNLPAITTDWVTAAGVSAAAVTKIQSGLSTYGGGDTTGTTTLLGRLTNTRAIGLDNLDATISSRSTYSGGDTGGTTTLLGRLTALRATGLDNLDTTVSSRMATYTQPTGFLAATFPAGTIANTTNITAGTITTVGAVNSLSTAALAQFFTSNSGAVYEDAVDGSVVKEIAENVSSGTVGDSSGVTTLLSRLTDLRATNLDNLDAPISSRMAAFALPANFSTLSINGSGQVGIPTSSVISMVSGSVGSVSSTVSIASNVKKNQPLLNFKFLMTDRVTRNPALGRDVSVTRSIDGSSFVTGNLSIVTERGNGVYEVDFTAADMNGNVVLLRATAPDCDDSFERIITQP